MLLFVEAKKGTLCTRKMRSGPPYPPNTQTVIIETCSLAWPDPFRKRRVWTTACTMLMHRLPESGSPHKYVIKGVSVNYVIICGVN